MKKQVVIGGIFAFLSMLQMVGCGPATEAPVVPKESRGLIVGGYVVHPDASYEGQVRQQREIAHHQEQEISRKKREREDLERQRFYDERERLYLDSRGGQPEERVEQPDETLELNPAPVANESPATSPSPRKRY